MKDPEQYDGTPICPCCGNGWPVCAEVNPKTGDHFAHAESCERYEFADDLCAACEAAYQLEYQPPAKEVIL